MHATMQATKIIVERRFPLDLRQSISSIRELYETGKRERWDPDKDVPWDAFDSSAYGAATLDAARRVWSRRAWIEYTGLAETPALLIRFCLEAGREADPKYFLTVRNTEEAWHVECFHRLAAAFGGYLSRPDDRGWEPVFNQSYYRQALSAEQSLDAYVAVHCAVEDGLELALYELYAENARDPLVADVLARVLTDKRRHASFGWLYLEERARQMSAEARSSTASEIERWITHVAFEGYHIPSLASKVDASKETAALRAVAEAGLGAATPEAEEQVLRDYLGRARKRLGELGLSLGRLEHPRLGQV